MVPQQQVFCVTPNCTFGVSPETCRAQCLHKFSSRCKVKVVLPNEMQPQAIQITPQQAAMLLGSQQPAPQLQRAKRSHQVWGVLAAVAATVRPLS